MRASVASPEKAGTGERPATATAVVSDTVAEAVAAVGAEDGVAASCKKRPLLPILPRFEAPTGVLGVDREDTRVVYLAPLVSTSKEIYFAKHKELLNGTALNNAKGGGEGVEEQGGGVDKADVAKRKMLALVERQLARVRPAPQLASLNQQPTSSIFDAPALDLRQRAGIAVTGAAVPEGAAGEGTSDVEIKKMKKRVHLLPISDEERSDFWETIRDYERMRPYYRRTSLASRISTPVGFNMEAAFNKILLDERHLLWTRAHNNRLELTRTRKEEEDESHEQRMLASSSENRARERLRRQMYEQLLCEAQNMQPIVMLGAFTQKMLGSLVRHWNRNHLEAHLRRIVRVWRDHRSVKRKNIREATLLLEWLQKSVAVRTVGFRVFRGLRIFVRRVKRLQGLWRTKVAVRRLKFLRIQKLWVEYETEDVENAIENHESKRIEADQFTTQKKPGKLGSSQKGTRRGVRVADQWMTFVPETIRTQVIHAFLLKVEREFVLQFRQQELEFFPQLVQTLRGEHPNRARSYIRAVAMRYALSGQVIENLLLFPGAVGEGVEIVKPFNICLTPMASMQNDDGIRQELELEAANQSEGYRKQLALLLQRRKQVRQTVPVTKDVALSAAPPSPSEAVAVNESTALELPEKMIPRQSFALVVASYTFRNLPPLSEKIKDVASSLFNSLVDQHFNAFSRRGSRLLLNPSVIEFQDTMKDLQRICAEEPNSSFFMCLASHGARVSRGENEGSYVLFSETRLTSEEELLLTAVHERELAEMIQRIPCKHKFVALELCQTQEPKEKMVDDAETIRHRIHDQFMPRLYNKIVQLRLEVLLDSGLRHPGDDGPSTLTEEAVRTNPKLLNLIMVESCFVANEIPVRSNEDSVSNFLLRLRDAFRGGAVVLDLEDEHAGQQQGEARAALFAKRILEYVCHNVRRDAAKHNDQVHAEYKSQVRTKYERAAEFQDITHTPSVMGVEHATDFGLGKIPEPPTVSPSSPTFISSTLNCIRVQWNFTAPNMISEFPTILGFHVQRRGHGRACTKAMEDLGVWKRASSFQVLTYEQVAREHLEPPTTITAYGLQPDMAYCFRVRARTAGGWGPFSEVTPGYRTMSTASTTDQLETVRIAAVQGGVRGVADLMKKRTSVGVVQRLGVEVLAKMAIPRPAAVAARENPATRMVAASDLPLVVTVHNAMQKFQKDMRLQQHGCLLFGRLAASSESWRTTLLSVTDPPIVQLVRSLANRSGEDHNQELTCSATWALRQLQSSRTVARRRPGCTRSPHEAATRIQTLFRYRKAQEHIRTVAQSVYRQAVDPTSGANYFINTRTGATFWALPSFIS